MIDLTFSNTIPGMLSSDELIILSNLASLVPKNGKILEIGSFLGRSAAALHAGKDPTVTLTVIDKWSASPSFHHSSIVEGDISLYNSAINLSIEKKTYRAGFELCMNKILHEIEILQKDSKNFLDHQRYDLIFIDGDHDSPEYDVYNSIKDSRTLVCGDDFFHEQFPNVRKTVLFSREHRVLMFPRCPHSKLWSLIPVVGYWRNNITKVFDAMSIE